MSRLTTLSETFDTEIKDWLDPANSEVTSKCSIPLEAPQSTLWQFVKTITQPAFDVFGSGVGDSIIEEITNETLNRSL